jgi:protein tyrosine/serine phosphatase
VDGPDAWHEFIKQGALDYSKARKYMMDAYTNIPFEDGHRYVYRAAFEGLLNEPGGVLVHCMAGKDRTGILCALIHHALGVPDDHKRADFLFTNHASDVEGRLDWFAEILGEYGGGPPVDREAARALFGVEADYLDHAFGQMGERFGSVDNYLSDFLLIGEPEKAALRAKFVE